MQTFMNYGLKIFDRSANVYKLWAPYIDGPASFHELLALNIDGPENTMN